MCLSKSSAGCRAVSKVTSTNCWHSRLESTTKAPRNLCCSAKQNTPTIFPAEQKRSNAGYLLSWTICNANRAYGFFSPGCCRTTNQAAIGFVRSHQAVPPGRVLTSLSSAEAAGTAETWQRDRGFSWGFSDVESEDTPCTLSLQFLKPRSTAFCTWIKTEIHSGKRSGMNKSYKTQIMPAD